MEGGVACLPYLELRVPAPPVAEWLFQPFETSYLSKSSLCP